jgi:hypothetical protein
MVLTGLQCPLQALLPDVTAAAYDLGLFDLQDGRTRVADGEEELRILIEACRIVAPVHKDTPSRSVNLRPGAGLFDPFRGFTSWFQGFELFTRADGRSELSFESHNAYAVAVTTSERPSGAARRLLLAAAAIVLVEALVFLALAGAELLDLTSSRAGLGVGVALFLAVIGAGLLWAAWRVTEGDAWARSPLVLAQLVQLGLAWNFRGDPAWLTPAIALPAVAVLACLLAPPVTRALSDDDAV